MAFLGHPEESGLHPEVEEGGVPGLPLVYGATAVLFRVDHEGGGPDPVDEAVARKAEAVRPGLLRDFGGRRAFSGPISTVRAFENNPLVREALGEPGNGRVLVVDGGASLRCALLGDEIAAMGSRNGWQGIVLNACVRDSAELAGIELGIKALGTHPLKSSKRDRGLRDVEVHFGGVRFRPGAWLYADADGVLVCTEPGRPLEA